MRKDEIKDLLDNMGNNLEKDILKYMVDHGEISPWEAMTELRCMRLSARMYDLKNRGVIWDKRTEYNDDGKHWAVYFLRYTS